MNIQIYNTDKIVRLAGADEQLGIPARIWEGVTDGGIKVHCFISRIAISKEEPEDVVSFFEKELQETRRPSAEVNVYPLRLVL